jgi:glycosyltransferase involved in cell wall biosynthesis
MTDLKISVVTACYNNQSTIQDTIRSVLDQSYRNIEYIIIDGQSNDGTVDIIKSFGDRISKFVSEPDAGMYDAINKGLKLASGEIVGILNSDDFFYDSNVIMKIVESFNIHDIDAVYGDAIFVKPLNTNKIVRYYSSKNFCASRFRFGFMPAHPTFYVKRKYFEEFGYYKTDYTIGADFDLLVRFLYVNHLKYKYIEMPFLIMRMGGISNKNIVSKITLNKEIARACRENNLSTNYFLIYSKYITKIFEFFGNGNSPRATTNP